MLHLTPITFDELEKVDLNGPPESFLVEGMDGAIFVSPLHHSFDCDEKKRIRCFIHPRGHWGYKRSNTAAVYRIERK